MLQSKTQVGKLDERVTIQQKTIGTNESNEDAETGWEDVVSVWSEWGDESGSEVYQAEKLTAVTGAFCRIRYRTGLNEEMRIVRGKNSKYYGITAIVPEDRKRYLKITVESGNEYVETVGGFSQGFSEGFDV